MDFVGLLRMSGVQLLTLNFGPSVRKECHSEWKEKGCKSELHVLALLVCFVLSGRCCVFVICEKSLCWCENSFEETRLDRTCRGLAALCRTAWSILVRVHDSNHSTRATNFETETRKHHYSAPVQNLALLNPHGLPTD